MLRTLIGKLLCVVRPLKATAMIAVLSGLAAGHEKTVAAGIPSWATGGFWGKTALWPSPRADGEACGSYSLTISRTGHCTGRVRQGTLNLTRHQIGASWGALENKPPGQGPGYEQVTGSLRFRTASGQTLPGRIWISRDLATHTVTFHGEVATDEGILHLSGWKNMWSAQRPTRLQEGTRYHWRLMYGLAVSVVHSNGWISTVGIHDMLGPFSTASVLGPEAQYALVFSQPVRRQYLGAELTLDLSAAAATRTYKTRQLTHFRLNGSDYGETYEMEGSRYLPPKAGTLPCGIDAGKPGLNALLILMDSRYNSQVYPFRLDLGQGLVKLDAQQVKRIAIDPKRGVFLVSADHARDGTSAPVLRYGLLYSDKPFGFGMSPARTTDRVEWLPFYLGPTEE